jgi:hypothetical protein
MIFIAQGCVSGLTLSWKCQINVHHKSSHYEDIGNLRLLMELLRINGFNQWHSVCTSWSPTITVQWKECCCGYHETIYCRLNVISSVFSLSEWSGQAIAMVNFSKLLDWVVGSKCLVTKVTWPISFTLLSLGTYEIPGVCSEVEH